MSCWRISRWLPAGMLPVGVLGLGLSGGALGSGAPWFVAVWWVCLGALAAAAAAWSLLERRRAYACVEEATLTFRTSCRRERSVDLAQVRAVALRRGRLADRRQLLVLETADGDVVQFPAWAAWERQRALVDVLRRQLLSSGARVDPAAEQALR